MVTEKKKLSSLIRFHSASKIYNYNGVGGGGVGGRQEKKKRKKKESSRVTAVRVLSGAGRHSPLASLGCPPRCAGLWTCSGGSSDSDLVLRLCVLASNVHSCQNWCVFFCGSSQWPFIYCIDTDSTS